MQQQGFRSVQRPAQLQVRPALTFEGKLLGIGRLVALRLVSAVFSTGSLSLPALSPKCGHPCQPVGFAATYG